LSRRTLEFRAEAEAVDMQHAVESNQ
jgi:hypothetical protein